MRWHVLTWVLAMLGACTAAGLTGCATAENAESARTAEADDRGDQHQVDRQAVTRTIQQMPEVGAARLVVGRGLGGEGIRNITVTVARADGQPMDEQLAQRIVERVAAGFDSLSPSDVAVRDASDPTFLYLGDLGRFE